MPWHLSVRVELDLYTHHVQFMREYVRDVGGNTVLIGLLIGSYILYCRQHCLIISGCELVEEQVVLCCLEVVANWRLVQTTYTSLLIRVY